MGTYDWLSVVPQPWPQFLSSKYDNDESPEAKRAIFLEGHMLRAGSPLSGQ